MTYHNRKSFNSEGCNQSSLRKILGSELSDTAPRYRRLKAKSVRQTDSAAEKAADLPQRIQYPGLLFQASVTAAELPADLKNLSQ